MNAVVNVFKVNNKDNRMTSIHTMLVFLFITLKKSLPAQPGREKVIPLDIHFGQDFLKLLYHLFLCTQVSIHLLVSSHPPAAFPFMTSPSNGIFSPAHTRINVPILIFSTGTVSLLSARTAVSGVFNINSRR